MVSTPEPVESHRGLSAENTAYKTIALTSMGLAVIVDLFVYLGSSVPIFSNQAIRSAAISMVALGCLAAFFYWLRERYHAWVNEVFQILLILAAIPTITTIGHYLVLSYPMPLVDAYLAAPEQAIGLTHVVLYEAFHQSGTVGFFDIIYTTIQPQLALVALYLMLIRKDVSRLWQYASTLSVAALASIPALWFLPTMGPTEFYAGQYSHPPSTPDSVAVLEGLRQGVLTDLNNVTGMLACPSFHTVFALLLIRSMWDSHWVLRSGMIVINVLVILSTITSGAHYLIDIVGGIIWTIGAALFVAAAVPIFKS